jgi:tetratricopeptide (TPR) repeat protein
MQGRLSAGAFPNVLRTLHGGRLSGVLRLTYGEARSGLVFSRGHLVRGESSVPQLHMGEVMVAHGMLSRDALEQATLAVIAEHKRLGQALEDLGFLTHSQVEEGLGLHVREILTDAFCWKDGAYSFEENTAPSRLEDDYPLRQSTAELVVGAVRAIPSREVVLHALGRLDRVLLPASDPFLRFQRLTLTPVDGFVLSRIDGAGTAGDVLSLTPLAPEAVEHSLLALVCAGLVEFVSEAPKPTARNTAQFLRQEILDAYAALATRTPHEILGVPPGASAAEVKAAYFLLARRYHPDIQHDPALADLGEKLETLFFRITAAYDAITGTARREPLASSPEQEAGSDAPPGPATVDADDLYKRAEERFGEGRYWEAIALLSEVVTVATGRLRPRARVLLARAYLKYPEHVKTAERELLTALQEGPDQPETYYVLGTVYKRGGLQSRATAMFRRATELNPRHRAAQAELDQAGEPPTPGALRKFFGRP